MQFVFITIKGGMITSVKSHCSVIPVIIDLDNALIDENAKQECDDARLLMTLLEDYAPLKENL